MRFHLQYIRQYIDNRKTFQYPCSLRLHDMGCTTHIHLELENIKTNSSILYDYNENED
jgi:hypothetical protein